MLQLKPLLTLWMDVGAAAAHAALCVYAILDDTPAPYTYRDAGLWVRRGHDLVEQ